MKDIVKIAWRNLWRNRRRTLITAASIFFAIFFAATMRSFQLGTYGHMIKQSIESYTGYLQIQNSEYFDDPCIDNVFMPSAGFMDSILSDPNVKVAVPRVESFALASTGNLSKGVIVTGISPEKERYMSDPEQKLVRYRFTEKAVSTIEKEGEIPPVILNKIRELINTSFTSEENIRMELGLTGQEKNIEGVILRASSTGSGYLDDEDKGVLISDRLSKYLKADVGDSVILMGQGYQGASAASIYPVRGIVKIPSPELDNKLIYMTIEQASELFSLSGQITSVAINLKDTDEMKDTQERLARIAADETITVKNWEELAPTLKQQIEGDNKSGQIFVAILYIIIFFGIFGTVQMMISERTREFGVMVSIGMKRGKLAAIVTFEMLFLGFVGAASGLLASVPVILYGYYHPFRFSGEMAQMYVDMGFDPVMPMAWFEGYFFMQALVVFIMVLFACYLPVRSILRLNVIKAIRG
jgi:ABC-type lipoprotein release transport system permease subunit